MEDTEPLTALQAPAPSLQSLPESKTPRLGMPAQALSNDVLIGSYQEAAVSGTREASDVSLKIPGVTL